MLRPTISSTPWRLALTAILSIAATVPAAAQWNNNTLYQQQERYYREQQENYYRQQQQNAQRQAEERQKWAWWHWQQQQQQNAVMSPPGAYAPTRPIRPALIPGTKVTGNPARFRTVCQAQYDAMSQAMAAGKMPNFWAKFAPDFQFLLGDGDYDYLTRAEFKANIHQAVSVVKPGYRETYHIQKLSLDSGWLLADIEVREKGVFNTAAGPIRDIALTSSGRLRRDFWKRTQSGWQLSLSIPLTSPQLRYTANGNAFPSMAAFTQGLQDIVLERRKKVQTGADYARSQGESQKSVPALKQTLTEVVEKTLKAGLNHKAYDGGQATLMESRYETYSPRSFGDGSVPSSTIDLALQNRPSTAVSSRTDKELETWDYGPLAFHELRDVTITHKGGQVIATLAFLRKPRQQDAFQSFLTLLDSLSGAEARERVQKAVSLLDDYSWEEYRGLKEGHALGGTAAPGTSMYVLRNSRFRQTGLARSLFAHPELTAITQVRVVVFDTYQDRYGATFPLADTAIRTTRAEIARIQNPRAVDLMNFVTVEVVD